MYNYYFCSKINDEFYDHKLNNEYLSQLKRSIQLKKDMVNNKRDKIRVLEIRLQQDEADIIQEKIGIDILMEEIEFLVQRRTENE